MAPRFSDWHPIPSREAIPTPNGLFNRPIHHASFHSALETLRKVSPAELPHGVRQFISRYINSVEELEILLLLRQGRDVSWTVQAVYDIILSTPLSVERWLNELVRQGLLISSDQPPLYRYAATDELAEQVTALAECYKITPVRIIESVYRPKADAAQSFADAFKLKNPP